MPAQDNSKSKQVWTRMSKNFFSLHEKSGICIAFCCCRIQQRADGTGHGKTLPRFLRGRAWSKTRAGKAKEEALQEYRRGAAEGQEEKENDRCCQGKGKKGKRG
ncbi:hypothetical protein ElyMa_003158800 [Elysia marginata]|uniref:Uncharacterized protein n=1 Tax=Elysia marginata TaxID=1093978 RepID=A0AAV4IVU5_9GAST|nr:hypothetical protein ElyMa_003158800 [Elysia marginata]